MEPTGHRLDLADRAGLAGQDQESGLECVFGVVRIAQDLPASSQDHRAMTLYQGRQGRMRDRSRSVQKAPQQVGVGKVADRPDQAEDVQGIPEVRSADPPAIGLVSSRGPDL